MIKKFTRITTLVALLSVSAITAGVAQITLQSTNLPSLGDNITYKMITDTTIQPGSGGAGVVWDFSNYIITVNTVSEEYELPLTTGNDAAFTGANLKLTSFFGWTDYYIKNGAGTELQYLGFYSPSNELFISSVAKTLTVPFTYNSTVTNVPVTGTGYSGAVVTGTISTIADGYGTLKVQPGQGGPYNNTLRVKYDINLSEDLGGLITTFHAVRYAWYRSGLRAPVFQISILDIDGVLGHTHQKFSTFYAYSTDVDDLSKPTLLMSVFPNPASTTSKISYTIDRTTEVSLKVMDITGRVWKHEDFRQTVGEHSFVLDVSDLPKGVYILSLSAGTTTRQQRLLIQE
ncbi:MAG: T9SS type A sorting domain-containing protein [Bacteroidetes bacterium]|nr:T9SS type A sorting domain-containing protein [Bacteroidota bacterium]